MADKHTTQPADAPPAEEIGASAAETEQAREAPDSLAELQRERDDYYDRLLRKTAEFDNYRRRIERERREQGDQAVTSLLLELLLVVDDFDRALTHPPGAEAADATAYRQGVELIHAKLHELLRKHGVQPLEALGTEFDPNLHQAVSHEASPEHKEGEVIGELRRGYTLNGRLLRPAMVKVAKA